MGKWVLAAGHHHLFHIIPGIVARARGYFEAEGAGECDFLTTGSDANTLTGMKDGKYQVGLDPKPFFVAGAKANEAADLWVIGGFLNTPAYAFMAAKGRGITRLQDLKGKRVAVREPDGIDARFTRQVFRRNGLNADEMVHWVCNGSPSRRFQQPAMDSGETDAAMIILRDVSGMIEEGYPMLADLREIYPHGYAVRTTAVRGDVMRQEPERLTGLMRALIRAYRFMNQRYEETMEIVKRADYKFDKDMDSSLWETRYHMMERVPQDASVSVEGLAEVIEEEKIAGKLPRSFGVKDILVDRFYKEAVASVNQRFGKGCE